MIIQDILNIRLLNHRLVGEKFKTPEEVVEYYGGIQAQDYAQAKWSVGQRIEHATDQTLEDAYNNGRILRTHVLRPTWHYVLPNEIDWMLQHTAPRIRQFMATYDKKLDIDADLRKKVAHIFTNALKDKNYKTRTELAHELEKNKISAKGQRLGHLVMHAELDRIIISGPRRGKQFTYALFEERIKPSKPKPKTREEAISTLATKYFRSHGPAQMRDFLWWTGLTLKDGKDAVNTIKSKLEEVIINDKIYWFFPTKVTPIKKPDVHLLSIYDEYVIAYNDRSDLGDHSISKSLWSMGAALQNVIIVDGKIVGTWKRKLKGKTIDIQETFLMKPSSPKLTAFEETKKRYQDFFLS